MGRENEDKWYHGPYSEDKDQLKLNLEPKGSLDTSDDIIPGFSVTAEQLEKIKAYNNRPDYKYSEDRILQELMDYVNSTYGEHYAKQGTQTTEFLIENGIGMDFVRGNIIKYTQRYGKKAGYNRKDLLKVAHYAIIALHIHDLENEE